MFEVQRSDDVPAAVVLARMEAARNQLTAAKSVGDAKQVADGAAAIVEWLRRQSQVGLEIVNDAQLLKLQAEKRMGEFLRQPGAVKTNPGSHKASYTENTKPPAYSDLGLKRASAQQFRAVADVPDQQLQEMAEKATKAGRELTRKSVLKAAAKARPRRPDPKPQPKPAEMTDLLNVITTGDARELAKLIPDESVTLCFTDPVYERIEDYEWLAKECERVLVPGGSLIAQCGNMRRFEAECAMRRSALTYTDLLAEVYPYALCPIFPLRIQIGWKPYLWFTKGSRLERDGDWVMNRVHSKGKHAAAAAKSILEWGDSEDFSGGVLEKLCRPGEIIWDPFTGSGTVPVVAKRMGLPFIAFEIDAARAEEARNRVTDTPRNEVVTQPALWGGVTE
jgi:hypothetical protein